MLPREIIYHVVVKYLDKDKFQQLRNEMGDKKYSDAQFIKLLEKYFDFSMLINNPKIPEDAWIYNYLYYEVRKKDNQNPFTIGDAINFKGKLTKRGLLLKYYNNVSLDRKAI